MLRIWMRRMGAMRLVAMMVLAVFAGTVYIEMAEARFGRSRGGSFRSFGNRGSRSADPGQMPGRQMQPIDRSRQTPNAAGGVNGAGNRGSWLQRNPLMAGIMGAVAGTVLGSMLMNAMGGMGGFGGILMVLILGMVAFAVIQMLRQRKQAPVGVGGPTDRNAGLLGGINGATKREYSSNAPRWGSGADNTGGNYDTIVSAINTQSREQGLAAIALEDPKMSTERLQDTLSTQFFLIQEAWSDGDRTKLNLAMTSEMYDEFIGDLDDMERRGERNIIKNIVMRSFEITEAWQEGEIEYATAHINARLVDYVERNGQVIEGDATNPTQFTEFWTFTRSRGQGGWKLSAINQEA